jgi:hypothetical protein
MKVRHRKTWAFAITALAVAAFNGLFFLFADDIDARLWLIPLALNMPAWPLAEIILSALRLPEAASAPLQLFMTSALCGLVAAWLTFIYERINAARAT